MNRTARSALLFAATMLFVGAASATALSDANDGDMAGQFLDVLLGASTDSTTTSVSALAAGMRMFNIFALTAGTVLFTYMVVVGTLRSAEDGELLGKQWSSMWIPLRFMAGCAMLVPLGSGYSTAQTGMIALAKGGSTAASAVWRESAGYMAGGGDRTASQLNSAKYAGQLDASIRNVLKAESCVVAMRDQNAHLGATFGLQPLTKQPDGSYLAEWGYTGPPDAQPFTRRECGKLTTAAYQPVDERTNRSFTVVDNNGIPQEVQSANRGDADAPKLVIAAQAGGIVKAATVLRPAAEKVAGLCGAAGQQACLTPSERAKVIDDAVTLAAAAYTSAVQPALRALYASAIDGDKLLKASTGPGWVMAGTTMFTMARIQTEITKLEGWMPNVSPPGEDEKSVQGVIGSDDASSLSWASDMGSKAKNDVANSLGDSIAQKIAYMMGGDPTDKRHILIQLKEGGDQIMTWMQSILAVVGIAGMVGGKALAVAGTVGKFIPGMDLLASAGQAVGVAALVLFMSGVVMSLVLPLMPFVLWAGSVLGWLVAVVQAIIAAPVWIAAHLHPDGDDLTGKGQNGYMILLEVTLRPTFMVLGLVAALALVDIMGRWVGYAFFATVDSVQGGGSATGIASIVTIVIIYLGLTFTIVRTCFGLVHDVPSTILTWIGGAHAGHDKGADFGHAAQGQINQGMQRAEAPMAGMAVRAMGGSKKSARHLERSVDGGRAGPGNGASPSGESNSMG